MSKVITDINSAFAGLEDGMTVLAGGFGLCGIPEHGIEAIRAKGTKGLTVVSNNCGVDDFGLGRLLENKQIDKMISSYVGENKIFEQQFISGELNVELTPQGTLAEKLRAGGAGIPAFYTKTGVGTLIAEDKETRDFDGETYLMERSIKGDFGIVKAQKADTFGNLVFEKTARNFNPLCAMAAKTTVVEVEELVEVGEIDPDDVHLSGVYVDYIYHGAHFEKRIEKRTVKEANHG
ncbi:CoA transferase subunit A [Staphylococcus caeli]|uniref:CoA transferase subunit A n=1 Tax=Staphylococcus caeli TaxID=2201815 RepID=UPI003F545E1B